ncbi:MAG: 3-hydroxyacyl-CoA dehydrogenase NAD-binding domain-containing protein [Rhizomicrobium sp.]
MAEKIALIGTGVIGRGWATVFARAGRDVVLFDADEKTRSDAPDAVGKIIALLDGVEAPLSPRRGTISTVPSLEAAVDGADWIQESIPERLAIKREMFERIDRLAAPHAVLSSSCSAFRPSDFLTELSSSARCIIAHPFNPPYLLRLVELVPSPQTAPETVAQALQVLRAVGQKPIVVAKEIFGFAGNRLQFAVVNEAMHLVAEGVVTPEEADLCLTEALGLRWAFLGPLETMDLNAPGGFAEYAAKYRHSYEEGGRDLGVARPWTEAAVAQVTAWRRRVVPERQLPERQGFRDAMLARLRGVVADAHSHTKDEQAP